jgi:hypothetical protein
MGFYQSCFSLIALSSTAFGSALKSRCSTDFLSIKGVTIDSIEHHPNGYTILLPDTVPSCGGYRFDVNTTADLCRVVMTVPTTETSSIRVEAWLPDDWNGRSLATGNGGTGGCIGYDSMQNGAQLGFAAFGTNAGHDGQAGYDFFLNQPESINDWGSRAIHFEAQAGKNVTSKYYGTRSFKSYYAGCSTGGRQGIQTAQIWPDDFDGILVGAPGLNWLRIVASKAILAKRIGWPNFDSPAYVRPEQWTAIVAKQIELLDSLDGVKNGIIDDPTDFSFDPQLLACGTGALNDSVCLGPEQVLSVKKAYEPLYDSKGRNVYPGFDLGANTGVFSNNQVNGSNLGYRLVDDFWIGAVYNDTSFRSQDFEVADMDFAVELNPGGIAFNDPDLSGFYKRGGKVLAYHGSSDVTVTSALSLDYFGRVRAALNLNVEEMLSFYRLFLVPGMGHCSGGVGAWDIGQTYPLDKNRQDAKNNVLMALVDWVENSTAPDEIVGTKYRGDNVANAITAQRSKSSFCSRHWPILALQYSSTSC